MKRSRFSEEAIIRFLDDYRSGKTTKELCADHNISTQTLYNWKRKYGEMDLNEARKLRALEDETKRLRATRRTEVWSCDFVHDQTACGGSFRMLSILDEHTRQCHGLEPRHSYRATDVIKSLERLIARHGAPAYIRSDNGVKNRSSVYIYLSGHLLTRTHLQSC